MRMVMRAAIIAAGAFVAVPAMASIEFIITKTDAEANFHPAAAPDFIQTQGYHTPGVGGALYQNEGASAPAHPFKFSITLSGGGGTVWYGLAPSERPVNPEMLGAIGNDSGDDTTALHSTLQATVHLPGLRITGLGKTYRINGNVSMAANTWFEDATLVQTASSLTVDTRTLTNNCGGCNGPFTVKRVKIDLSLRATSDGSVGGSAGLWLSPNAPASSVSNVLLEDVEVTGNGKGSGIIFVGGTNVTVVRPYVHDMEWSSPGGTDPGSEQMQGIRCSSCTNFELINPRVERLWGTIPWVASANLSPSQGLPWRAHAGNSYRATTTGGAAGSSAPTCTGTPGVTACSDGLKTWTYMGPSGTARRSYQADCITISQTTNATITGGHVQWCWEGIDISGSGTNSNVWIYETVFEDADAFGVKFAHNAVRSGVVGVRSIRAGYAGFYLPSAAPPDVAAGEHLRVVSSVAVNTGSNGNWSFTATTGFWTDNGSILPVDIQLIDCIAIDTGPGTGGGTMQYGFRNGSGVPDGMILVNARSYGHTVAATNNVTSMTEFLTDGAFKVTGPLIVTGEVSGPNTRPRLTAARTYYVATSGSDSNDGLTPAAAFLTIQKALDVVHNTIDLGGQTVTIQVADGTYTGVSAVSGPFVGMGAVVVTGNAGTPANVLVSTSSGSGAFILTAGASLQVKNLKVTTSIGSAFALADGAQLEYANLDFGPVAARHIQALRMSRAICLSNYKISGGGLNHMLAGYGSTIECESRTITLTGTPAFSNAFMHVSNASSVRFNTNTFAGSATGTRYGVELNGTINTSGGGPNYLPGNAAGVTATGGQYSFILRANDNKPLRMAA